MISLCHIKTEKFLMKLSTKNMAWKLVPGSFLFKMNKAQPLTGNLNFLKHADSVGYMIAKLSKYVKISMQTSSDFLLQRIF